MRIALKLSSRLLATSAISGDVIISLALALIDESGFMMIARKKTHSQVAVVGGGGVVHLCIALLLQFCIRWKSVEKCHR